MGLNDKEAMTASYFGQICGEDFWQSLNNQPSYLNKEQVRPGYSSDPCFQHRSLYRTRPRTSQTTHVSSQVWMGPQVWWKTSYVWDQDHTWVWEVGFWHALYHRSVKTKEDKKLDLSPVRYFQISKSSQNVKPILQLSQMSKGSIGWHLLDQLLLDRDECIALEYDSLFRVLIWRLLCLSWSL